MSDVKNPAASPWPYQPTALPSRVASSDPATPSRHGDPDSAGIFAGHDEFGERAHNQSNDSFPNPMKHTSPLDYSFESSFPLSGDGVNPYSVTLERRGNSMQLL